MDVEGLIKLSRWFVSLLSHTLTAVGIGVDNGNTSATIERTAIIQQSHNYWSVYKRRMKSQSGS